MRSLKKLTAIILAVCLLIGVPLSVDVGAVATSMNGSAPFALRQALVVPDEWNTGLPSDRCVSLYFTGDVQIDTEKVGAVITIHGGSSMSNCTGQTTANYSSTTSKNNLGIWEAEIKTSTALGMVNNYYLELVNENITISNIITCLKADSQYPAWRHICVRLFDKEENNDGIIDGITAGTATLAQGKYDCNATGQTASSNGHDCLDMVLTTIDDGNSMPLMTAEYNETTQIITMNFSKEVVRRPGTGAVNVDHNNPTVLRVVDQNGEYIYKNNETGAYVAESELTSATGYTLLGTDANYVDITYDAAYSNLPFRGTSWAIDLTSDYHTTVNTISGTCASEVFNQCKQIAEESGFYVAIAVEENAKDRYNRTTLTKANGESLNNGRLDSVFHDSTLIPLMATASHGLKGDRAVAIIYPKVDTDIEAVLESGTAYSFMNADTGREITVGGTSDFVVNAVEGGYTIKVGDQYVDLANTALSATEIVYPIYARANERYQIVVNNGMLKDTDEGTTNVATLTVDGADSNAIYTGWYLTKAGEQKPLKIMPVGDSITAGVNPDTLPYRLGWRDDLSKALDDDLDRYVFVGSQSTTASINKGSTTYVATLDDTVLGRHEAYPGSGLASRTVDNTTYPAIYDKISTTIPKYTPDVVLLMAGVNDLANEISLNGLNDAAKSKLSGRTKWVYDRIQDKSDNQATVIFSTLTPTTQSEALASAVEWYNGKMLEAVETLAANEANVGKIMLADSFSAFDDLSKDLSSDKLHLSMHGDVHVADAYEDVITSLYDANGKKVTLAEKLNNAKSGDVVTVPYDTTLSNVVLNAGVVLDLNGKRLTVDTLASFGDVIDGSNGNGYLVVTKNNVLLSTSESKLPLYDDAVSGFRFYDNPVINGGSKNRTETSIKYGMILNLPNAYAYDLLAANADVEIAMELNFTVNATNKTLRYVFQRSTVQKYVDTVKADPDTIYAITLTVMGLDDSITVPDAITPRLTAFNGSALVD